MKKIALFIILTLTVSCKENKEKTVAKCDPGGYKAAMKRGEVPNKTTTLIVGDTTYTLDYVRDHEGKWSAYGNLELGGDDFKAFLIRTQLSSSYQKPEKVHSVVLFGEHDDIEKAVPLQWQHIACYAVVYTGKDNYATLDFKDERYKVMETYRISQSYASVKDYLLRQRSGITDNPCIVEIKNTDADRDNVMMILQSEDILYQKARAAK